MTLYDFTAAPLLLLPLSPLALGVARLTDRFTLAAVLLTFAIITHWLVCTFAYQHRAARREPRWLAKRVLVSAMLWGIMAWCCFMLTMMIIQAVLWRPRGR